MFFFAEHFTSATNNWTATKNHVYKPAKILIKFYKGPTAKNYPFCGIYFLHDLSNTDMDLTNKTIIC